MKSSLIMNGKPKPKKSGGGTKNEWKLFKTISITEPITEIVETVPSTNCDYLFVFENICMDDTSTNGFIYINNVVIGGASKNCKNYQGFAFTDDILYFSRKLSSYNFSSLMGCTTLKMYSPLVDKTGKLKIFTQYQAKILKGTIEVYIR